MTENDIKHIIAIGESYKSEFKQTIPKKVRELAEEICAFANATGGILLLGVTDDGIIKGIQIDNQKKSAIQDAISNISPSLNCEMNSIMIDGTTIFYIKVDSGRNKPYLLSGNIFVRFGPNTQKLTNSDEVRNFFQQSGRILFDEIPSVKFDIKHDFDIENIAVFKAESNISNIVSNEQILSNLNLFDDSNTIKNGAVLFFAKNPDKYIDSAYIRCLRYQGKTKTIIRDDKIKKGPLYKQYTESIEWLKDKLEVGYIIEGTGPSKENWEIPKEAFKETIINALSHRDYYEKGACIMLEVFDDRVEISNPGGLIPAIPASQFGKRSLSRNPLVFGLFNQMGMVEKVGSGIPRVREMMKKKGLPEPVYETQGMFTVTFFRAHHQKAAKNDTDNNISVSLTKNQTMILDRMKQNPEITIVELADLIGISTTAIENNIKKLREMKKLDRIGSDKTGLWEVL